MRTEGIILRPSQYDKAKPLVQLIHDTSKEIVYIQSINLMESYFCVRVNVCLFIFIGNSQKDG